MDKLLVIAFIALAFALAGVSYKLFGIDKVECWLLWAVTKAESIYGNGTGKLKLAYAYDYFIAKFPKLQIIIPYKLFSMLVDKALVEMREMLKNKKISEIIASLEKKE